MRQRIALWLVVAGVFLALNLLYAGVILATDERVWTRAYRLDSGHLVRAWLDESPGVWCAAIFDGDGRPAGLSCVGLVQTAYAWAIGGVR